MKFPKKDKFGDEPIELELKEKTATIHIGCRKTMYSSHSMSIFKSRTKLRQVIAKLQEFHDYLEQIGHP